MSVRNSDRTVPTRPAERTDRRQVRRQETKAQIVAAAWELVREHGLAGLSMRDLGERVGMRAQSIYSYFASKFEIYDAMFLEGYLAFSRWMEGADPTDEEIDRDPVAAAQRAAHRFFEFCTSDPVRYQLLFQRTIPDFVPSKESYAVAVQVYQRSLGRLNRMGVTDPGAMDLWTALMTGLTDQQISNDPGGDRWERLIDRAVVMLLAEVAPHVLKPRAKQRPTNRSKR